MSLSLSGEDKERLIGQALEDLNGINPFFAEHPHLVEKAEGEARVSLPPLETVTVNKSDMDPSLSRFLRDDRMANWFRTTKLSTVQHLERKRKTPSTEIPQEQQDFSCFRYALTRIGIKVPCLDSSRALFSLIDRHFDPVEVPQEGDLVLFLQGKTPKHLGIYNNQMILSKEGDLESVAYLRPIEDLTPDYGDSVRYFRRRC